MDSHQNRFSRSESFIIDKSCHPQIDLLLSGCWEDPVEFCLSLNGFHKMAAGQSPCLNLEH